MGTTETVTKGSGLIAERIRRNALPEAARAAIRAKIRGIYWAERNRLAQ